MGILDDAIREHLELKRRHGAAENELKQLEGEAFGPAERPGSEGSEGGSPADAPTELLQEPTLEGAGPAEPADEQTADPPADLMPPEEGEQPRVRRSSEIAGLQEAPEAQAEPPAPSDEEAPAAEHEAAQVEEEQAGHSTEERHAIAGPPTELYDVEGEEFGGAPEAPSDEELVEELPVPESVAAEEEEEDEDFWDEKRLSDELDEALDAPLDSYEEEAPEEKTVRPEPPRDDVGEPEEAPRSSEHDVLDETPDFLEEAPEDDQLWFEQKPPKDFDFDD